MREEDDQLYIYKLYGIYKPRVIKAEKALRSKIGPRAKITDDQIASAQKIIDQPEIDFKPYALEYVQKIEDAVNAARQVSYMQGDDYYKITIPLTQIKGQATMFGNVVASIISARILKFMEHYQRLDEDVFKIMDVYIQSVRLSYHSRLFTLEQSDAHTLLSELDYAIDRYHTKFKQKTGR